MTLHPCRAGSLGLLAAVGLAVCLSSGEPTSAGEEPEHAPRVCVIAQEIRGLPLITADPILRALTDAGFESDVIDYERLSAAADALVGYDVAIIPDSPYFPRAGTRALQTFIRSGGDVVCLGGPAFQHPVAQRESGWAPEDHVRVADRWVPVADARALARDNAETQRVLLDFEDEDLARWERSSNRLETPSALSVVPGVQGSALRLDIVGLTGWDTQAAALETRIPEGHNCLIGWARGGDEGTRQLVLELVEDDGSRWISVVDVGTDWQRFALVPEDFNFWYSVPGRGGRGDGVNLQNVARISLGLAFGISTQNQGDHALLVDDIGTATIPRYEQETLALGFHLRGLTDSEPVRLEELRRPSMEIGERRVPWPTGMPVSGSEVVPLVTPRDSWFLPLLTGEDAERRRRCLGGAMLHFAGEYRASHWIALGVDDPGFYESSEFAKLLPAALKLLANPAMLKRAQSLAREDAWKRRECWRLNFIIGTQNFAPRYSFSGSDTLVESGRAMVDMGSTAFKGEISRRVFSANRLEQPVYDLECPPGVSTLVGLVKEHPSFRRLLDMPFERYLFWTYPLGGDSYVAQEDDRPHITFCSPLTPRQKANEYRELHDLAAYLLRRYSGSGKSFFLGHWEGDGMLLLAAGGKPGQDPPDEAIQGMIERLNVRQKAVEDARRDTPHKDVAVYHYLEVNRVTRPLRGEPGKSVVTDILPYTQVDYVSYSSYEATVDRGTPELPRVYKQHLDFIDAKLPPKSVPGRRVIIGEFGFPAASFTADQQKEHTRQVLIAGVEWGVPTTLYWQLYDNEGIGYWLIDEHGVRQPVYTLFRRFYAAAREFSIAFRREHGRFPTADEFRPQAVRILEELP